MAFLNKKSSIKAIRKGDHKFMITDGHVVSPRAGFEISPQCWGRYKETILECIANGWLTPVAYVKEEEFMWETLNDA